VDNFIKVRKVDDFILEGWKSSSPQRGWIYY